MRTEYTYTITDSKGRKQSSTYPRKYVMEHYLKAKAFYETRGCNVELYRIRYNGSCFYDAEKIEEC